MTEPSAPKPAKATAGETRAPVIPPESANVPPDPAVLTVEEQMALYEKHLKENDWGHQPC